MEEGPSKRLRLGSRQLTFQSQSFQYSNERKISFRGVGATRDSRPPNAHYKMRTPLSRFSVHEGVGARLTNQDPLRESLRVHLQVGHAASTESQLLREKICRM